MSAYNGSAHNELSLITNHFQGTKNNIINHVLIFSQITNPFITNFRIKRTFIFGPFEKYFGYNEQIRI